MKPSDELLMAYADGELDAEQRVQVDRACSQDPEVAAKIEQHRALRRRLKGELDGVLSEPIPERLLSVLRRPAADLGRGQRVEFHAPRKVTQRWAWREWTAMAACLVAGVGLGVLALRVADPGWVAARDGAVIAQDKLADALTGQLASTQTGRELVQVNLSFRARSGAYCRTFTVKQEPALAGLACRDGATWRVRMLMETAADGAGGAGYRQAGSATPAAILTLVEREIEGQALDAAKEAAARESGWQLETAR